MVRILPKWSSYLLEPGKRWYAELQTSSAALAVLEGRGCALGGLCEVACVPVCRVSLSLIRCEVWHWLQGNPCGLSLWQGLMETSAV